MNFKNKNYNYNRNDIMRSESIKNLNDLDIQIVSDLHIEYKNNNIPDPLKYITPVSKILILAGDIGSLYKIDQLKGFLDKLCIYFEIVLYVPGNHEYYMQHDMNCQPQSLDELNTRLYGLENEIENLYILNRKSIIIKDVCISGCTLWTKIDMKIPKFIVRINDMSTNLYNQLHYNDLKYINNMVDYCNKKKLKLVVITHHCPSFDIMENTYKTILDGRENIKKRDKFVSLYFSNLNHLLYKNKIDTWICGHIHQNFDFVTKNGTRLVGNQYGKPKDNIDDYSKEFIVKIENEFIENLFDDDELLFNNKLLFNIEKEISVK